jgi:hypothetical protein
MQVIEWLGMSAILLLLIGAIWSAFYGRPGQALRDVVQAQIFQYAEGFEGGVQTSGPSGSAPSMGQHSQPSGSGASSTHPTTSTAPSPSLFKPMLGVPLLVP